MPDSDDLRTLLDSHLRSAAGAADRPLRAFTSTARWTREAAAGPRPKRVPDLEGAASSEIVPANVNALAVIYLAAVMEELKLFAVADRVVQNFASGMLPVGRGMASRLYRYQRTAHERMTAAERGDLYARALGMGVEGLRTLRYGALLHDIGKIAIRSEILHKPEPLTESEYEEMKEHTVVGAKMLERIPYFADVHPLVRASHERWDGNGYPDRLAGEEIPLAARVISACDAFNAMTSDRPYRAAMDDADAIAELRRGSGNQFDPDVIDVLVSLLGVEEPSSTHRSGMPVHG